MTERHDEVMMTEKEIADEMLREAGVKPAPEPVWHPYARAGHGLFLAGRLQAWYYEVPAEPGLFQVHEQRNTMRSEIVPGEDVARALCAEWAGLSDPEASR
jgi:hypothetical protein